MSRGPKFPQYDGTLREELRRLRRAASLNQQEAADRCKVSKTQYGNYERGKAQIPANIMEFARDGFPLDVIGTYGFAESAASYAFAGAAPTLLTKKTWPSSRKVVLDVVSFVDQQLGR